MGSRRKFIALLLTFPVFLTVIPVCARPDRGDDDIDEKLSYAYILSMENIRKLGSIQNEVSDLLDKNEQISNKLEHDKEFERGSIAVRARAFEIKYPEIGTIIRKKGMSTREYVLGMQVLLRALFLVMKKQKGEIKDYSGAGPGINPANLAFVEEHLDEIRKSMHFRFRA